MDKKTNETGAARKASEASAHLTDLPLDSLSETQLHELLTRIGDAGHRKNPAEPPKSPPPAAVPAPTDAPDSENVIPDSETVIPDPSCFEELDGDADNSEPIEIVPGVILPPLTKEEADILTGETPVVGSADTAAQPVQGSSDPDPAVHEAAAPEVPEYTDSALPAPHAPQKKKQRGLLILLLSVLGVMLLMLLFLISYLRLYKPVIDNTLPFHPGTGDVVTGGPDSRPAVPDEPVTDDDLPEPAIIDSYARRDDVYNFLILGIDRAANLSDVIMIASYDVKDQNLHVLQIPRDTYIDVGSNYHKINAYFSAAYNRSAYRGEARYRDAIETMKSFLESGLCIKLDRYVCMDTEGFRAVIDAIGGVDMEVPFDMDYEDPYQDLYIHLKAGYQHLDGEGAEHFVRFRKAYLNGDIGRISAQQLFLTALAKQVKENLTVSAAVSAAKAVLDYVTTDITVAECGYFAKYAMSLDMNAISFTTLPGGNVANPDSGASYYVIYADAVRRLVNEGFNVYRQEITEGVFLSNNRKFQSSEVYINEVYRKKVSDTGTVTAGDIDRESIDIPVR